jgi:hypothetical protein
VSDLCEAQAIEQQIEAWFFDEIMGALLGKSADERSSQRISNTLHEALELPTLRLDENDQGALLPVEPGLGELPPLSGTDIPVRLAATATGIILIKNDGTQVTERRSLTQAELEEAPLDKEGYYFVNLHTTSGDLCSCLITKPDSQVFGSMRAFWWSLAKTTVITTDAVAGGTRMTPKARARVFSHARSMWDIAIKEAGSIDTMRDLIVPLRNVHLTVISGMKEKETHPAARLGLDVALAMVLATQSEDLKLEGAAFTRFKRFLWQPGEEPEEFYLHAASSFPS